MLNFYKISYTTYHNNTKIGTEYVTALLDENEVKEKENIQLTWDNVDNFVYKHGLQCKFNGWNCRKGKKISFFTNKFFGDYADVKEWKSPLNITIVKEAININDLMSIEEVLQWHDVDKAIQFLRERKYIKE